MRKTTLGLILILSFSHQALAASSPPTTKALKEYWEAYQAYIKKRGIQKMGRYTEALRRFEDDENKKNRIQLESELAVLKSAIGSYKDQIKVQGSGNLRADTILNISVALNRLANILDALGQDSDSVRAEAIGFLEEHIKSYPDHRDHDKALYFLASALEVAGQNGPSLAIWDVLAKSQTNNIYSIHANVIVGDSLFEKDNYQRALSYFKTALSKQQDLATKRFEPLYFEIKYRMAWAFYRSGLLEDTIESSSEIFKANSSDLIPESRDGMRKDAINLVASALYEMRDPGKIRAHFMKPDLAPSGPDILVKLMEKLQGVDDHSTVNLIASSLQKNMALSSAYPDILKLWSQSLGRLNLTEKKMEVLEDLALILPKNSLWRSRNGQDQSVISHMETLGREGALTAATWHMQRGIETGSRESFLLAEQLYAVIESIFAGDPEINSWKIQRALAQLQMDKLEEASGSLASLRSNLTLKEDELRLVSYQQVIVAEKIWRRSYARSLDSGLNPALDKETKDRLAAFDQSAEDFVNKYPSRNESNDLLLAVAGAWRDHGNTKNSTEKWRKVLLSKPQNSQRVTALRGLIFAPISENNHEQAISTITKFLKLEDWKTVGMPIKREFERTLSYVVSKRYEDLSRDAKFDESSDLLLSVAKSYGSVPNSDKFYRDGAYSQAMAGRWLAAEQSAKDYLAKPSGKFQGDMMYLEARAQEYQLKFSESAGTYIKLASLYPTHPKSGSSLVKAIGLAEANNSLKLQSDALALAVKREKKPEQKYQLLLTSADLMLKQGEFEKAWKLAAEAKSVAKIPIDKFNAEILEARILLDNQQVQTGLDRLSDIRRRADLSKGNLGREDWGEVVSKVELARAGEEMKKFKSASIDRKDKSLVRSLAIKSELFESAAENFSQVIGTGSKDFAPEARYKLAEAATELSRDIKSVLFNVEKELAFRDQERLRGQSERLDKLSLGLHGDNALAGTRDPILLGQNTWMRKSWLLMNGGKNSNMAPSIPAAARVELPNEWSLQ
jgi:outer membrane protein assembly factor BamD (BamD/ComL family)